MHVIAAFLHMCVWLMVISNALGNASFNLRYDFFQEEYVDELKMSVTGCFRRSRSGTKTGRLWPETKWEEGRRKRESSQAVWWWRSRFETSAATRGEGQRLYYSRNLARNNRDVLRSIEVVCESNWWRFCCAFAASVSGTFPWRLEEYLTAKRPSIAIEDTFLACATFTFVEVSRNERVFKCTAISSRKYQSRDLLPLVNVGVKSWKPKYGRNVSHLISNSVLVYSL